MSQAYGSGNGEAAGRAEIAPNAIEEGVATLSQIFIEHDGYVSDKWEQYLPAYEAVFHGFIEQQRPVRLLEIGIQNGGSLQIWSKYFPRGSTIVGIDIDPACAGFVTEPNVSIRIGDASDQVALDRMLGDAEFDVIIDDGSHRSDHVVATFNACFGRLSRGGLYIVEDLHCSYHSSHGGGFRLAGSSMEWFKGLADTLNADYFEPDAAARLDSAELERLREFGREIGRVTFFDSLVVVEKLTSEKRQPYRRIITGRKAHVVDVVGSIAVVPNALRTLLLPPAAAGAFTPVLLDKLASAREEVGQLRAALTQAEARQEDEMRTALASYEQRMTEAEARLAEETRRRVNAEQRVAEAEAHLAAEARQRTDAEQRVAQAEGRLAEETRQRRDAEQRVAQAEGRLAEEAWQRTDAEQRAAQAERRRAEEARHRAEAVAERKLVDKRLAEAEEQSAARGAELANLGAHAAQLKAERDELRHERDDVLGSTFWRITEPVRRVASVLPPGLRRQGRRSARVAYWILTPHRTRERIAYFRARREALPESPFAIVDPPPAEKPAAAEVAPAPDAKPPEPEITPPPISPVAGGPPGEVTIRTAAALAEIPWQPRPGQTPAAMDQAKARYQQAKLSMIRSGAGELLAELKAAMSAWAAGEAGEADAEALIRAVGIMPLYEPPAAPSEHFTVPILRRYREAQIATNQRLRLDHRHIGGSCGAITVSILMPIYRIATVYLERALLSVVCQTYQDWELCIVDSGSGDAGITAILDYYEASDQRIRTARIPENAGISAATNIALEMATGSYIGLLDHDDMLAFDTLEKIADHLTKDPSIDLLYTDECKIDENDIVQELMPKPDWSPLLLTAFMYTGHFSVYRTSIVRQLGGLRSEYDFSQDYDLALRIADLNPRVAHIRGYHYGWRMIAGSHAMGGKVYAREVNIAALQDAIERRGWGGTAVALPQSNRVQQRVEQEQSLVSIVIPTGGNIPMLKRCLDGILFRTNYRNFEVIILDNTDASVEVFQHLDTISADPRVKLIEAKGQFNFSRTCNLGAAAARGEIVVFLNDDVVVISPDWTQALLECIAIPGVGAVSPKLLYENNRIQHAGMVTGTRRLLGTAFHAYPRGTPANMGMAQSVREVSLLSAACLAMRKTIFNEVGGYDEINTPREHSDVDLCFRLRELGYSCIYTPHAELTHVGHVSMGAAESAGKVFGQHKHDIFVMKRFGAFLADDPYFPKPMWDILYTDSQEEFRFFPRQSASPGEDKAAIPAARNASSALDILIFSHDLTESGAPRAAFDVARTLRDAGHFVVVASPSDGPYRERLRNVGVDVIVDELLLSQQRHVSDFARNFDKVICNTVVCWPAVAQLHEVVDTYWYVHETELIRDFAQNVPGFAAVLKERVPIWADSRLAARFLNIYGVEPRIIEYGIEDRAKLRSTLRGEARKVVIGVFGTYEPRKGQDLAVNAMLGLSRQFCDHAELRLFGRTLPMFKSYVEKLEQLAAGHGSIVFFGEVEHDECLNQMAACDVILVPSRDDAMSFVALDALSLGKALVCSKAAGASEYLQDGVSAVILHDNTLEEIGLVLSRLIDDSGLRADLGIEARRVYESTFSPQSFTEKLLAALGLKQPAEVGELRVVEEDRYPVKSSWSIEGEDVVCKFLMDHLFQGAIEKGFFIDIGAHHPYRFSNTYLLYKHGWRGINIEPNPDFISEFECLRPADLTLNIALADHTGLLPFRRFANPLLNGFFTEEVLRAKIIQDNLVYLDTTDVPAVSVREFLTTYVREKGIDFLNIDVEGFESQILGSWDWQQYRPKLICAEIHGPSIEYVQQHEVHRILRREGYVFLSRIWQSSMFGDTLALRHAWDT